MASQTITALGNAIINLVDRKTPIATANTVGMVKPDGSTINIDANGVISSNGGSSGLEVCDIGMALYVDETKGLRRYLNGQVVDINTNTQKFLDRLKDIQTTNPDYFTTEDNWQAEATLNIDGCVYKFVLNYSGDNVVSVRLPKYPDYVEINANGTTKQIPVKTNQTAFGNNAGALAVPANNTNITYYVKSRDGSGNVFVNNEKGSSVRWYADLNGIELNSRTKLKMRYFIQIATGSETENNIVNDIELNNPYSLFDSKYSDHELNNLSWLKSEGQWNAKAVYTDAYDKLLKVYNGTETVEGLSVKLSTETYTDYDFVLNTADETFRLPLKTKLASGNAVVGNGMTLGLTDGTLNFGMIGHASGTYLQYSTENYNTNVGSNIITSLSFSNKTLGITTDETKSGIETSDSGLYLYFYVGETVQNANLIDAGRIGEQLANKQDKCIHIIETYINGTSGYRIWSDGYCEQWGRVTGHNVNITINFLKPFKDNNYNITQAEIGSGGADAYMNGYQFVSLTPTSMLCILHNDATKTCAWRASGYLAEGEY